MIETCLLCKCGMGQHLYDCPTLIPVCLEPKIMIIDSFRNKNRFLSNFFPCTVYLDGVSYPSVEHAYQAAKTHDLTIRESFRSVTASEAKRKGSNVLLRPDWEGKKLEVMKNLLEQKFREGTELRNMLDQTKGNTLVEGNYWHDNFWGDCSCNRRKDCEKEGRNHLGKLLMDIRDRNAK